MATVVESTASTSENQPEAADAVIQQQQQQQQRQRQSTEGDNDSGVDESTQEKERNGPTSPVSPVKSPSKIPSLRRPESITPHSRSRSTSKQRLTAKTPETPTEPLIKKIPMNKIQVGATPSPNLKVVRSKIGSLENATHKPGGGNVKIETKKKLKLKLGPESKPKTSTTSRRVVIRRSSQPSCSGTRNPRLVRSKMPPTSQVVVTNGLRYSKRTSRSVPDPKWARRTTWATSRVAAMLRLSIKSWISRRRARWDRSKTSSTNQEVAIRRSLMTGSI